MGAFIASHCRSGTILLQVNLRGGRRGPAAERGGAYNALLNTTSKFRASIAACLTILSYMATAVLSANEAMHYAHNLWSVFPVIPATILLLFVFMCIAVLGITESARVAVGIFITNLVSLALLLLVGLRHVIFNCLGTLAANMQTPNENGIVVALFFGFSAAMLGISGFSSGDTILI